MSVASLDTDVNALWWIWTFDVGHLDVVGSGRGRGTEDKTQGSRCTGGTCFHVHWKQLFDRVVRLSLQAKD